MARPAIKHKRFNMNISIKMYARLEQLAKDEETAITSLIRQLLRDGLRAMEQREREAHPAFLTALRGEEKGTYTRAWPFTGQPDRMP